MVVSVSSFLIYVNLCAREDARARVFRTSAAPLQLKPFYKYVPIHRQAVKIIGYLHICTKTY